MTRGRRRRKTTTTTTTSYGLRRGVLGPCQIPAAKCLEMFKFAQNLPNFTNNLQDFTNNHEKIAEFSQNLAINLGQFSRSREMQKNDN